MRNARTVSFVLAIIGVLLAGQDSTAARRQPARPPVPAPPQISSDTRLLVIAPHPDDEVLAAGGLIQKVHEVHGTVRVVYLTDGDGYPEGVKIEDRDKKKLSYISFRDYGRRRQKEARAALRALGLDDRAATFLSFPDSGLNQLIRAYWSEHRSAYRSPYTRRDRPPKSEWLVPDTEYRGEDLTQELAAIIGEFRPTLIAVPRRADQHNDHCAAWYFTADALGDVRRVYPDFTTDVLNYIVHYNDWPFQDAGPKLEPPPYLPGGASGWIILPLTPAEVRTKRKAIGRYRTQMDAMKWFLEGFVRSNEVFSRPVTTQIVLPLKRNPCTW